MCRLDFRSGLLIIYVEKWHKVSVFVERALKCILFKKFVSLPYIRPANTTLATVPANVARSAPVSVYRVLVTFAARKYTLIV